MYQHLASLGGAVRNTLASEPDELKEPGFESGNLERNRLRPPPAPAPARRHAPRLGRGAVRTLLRAECEDKAHRKLQGVRAHGVARAHLEGARGAPTVSARA
jgi:hypothetical protein